jgi:hypothetical protein
VAAAHVTRKNNNAAFEDQQRGVLFDGEQRGLENERWVGLGLTILWTSLIGYGFFSLIWGAI